VTSSESNIEDANFAQETSNLTRAQILVQAGTSVLSTANSTPQAVLKLLS
jgi:flagellin